MSFIRVLIVGCVLAVPSFGVHAALIQDIIACTTGGAMGPMGPVGPVGFDYGGEETCESAGSIEFPSDTGGSKTGVNLNLAFGGFSFDDSDIQSISWAISGSSWLLTALTMSLNTDTACLLNSTVSCTSYQLNIADKIEDGKFRANPGGTIVD